MFVGWWREIEDGEEIDRSWVREAVGVHFKESR